MKKFEDLNEKLKQEIEDIVKEDPFGLNAETLYKNIYNSSGPVEVLAELFNVSTMLVYKIRFCIHR